MNGVNGVIVLDKPAGITSAAAVNGVKRLLPRGTKIGHAGTLDPFATGVLLLLVGKATKRCESLMGQLKRYEATVRLGGTTETDDVESPERPTPGAAPVERPAIDAILPRFLGPIQQRPPMYSALKINGRRACDRVRDGETITPEPRKVYVYAIDLLHYAWPDLRLRIDCGRGTYIRALARDLGDALGVGGYLTQLRRTRIGDYDIADAVTVDALTTETLTRHVRQ
jgi:tRNA pseudouridine55 synthase